MHRCRFAFYDALALACALLLLPVPPFAEPAGALRPRSRFVAAADGVRIHCLEAGRGPAVLFLPGWTMPAEIWEPQLAHFAKSYRVVAMDPRSQGRSWQSPDGLYPAARARDVKAVVDQLKLAPVVLVGWSMGVTELASYIDQFGTDTVAGLVFVDGIAGGEFDPVTTPRMLQWLGAFQQDRRGATTEFVRGMYRKPRAEALVQRIVEASLRTPTDAAVALMLGAMTADNRAALAKIDKPTLLVVAPGPFTKAYQEMHKRIARSRLESFEGAGHALFVDDPERFNALLAEFLRSVHRRTAGTE